MGIESVTAVSKVKRVSRVGRSSTVRSLDLALFVEDLKEMPEIRSEIVDTDRAQPSTDELAHAILRQS